MKKIIIILSAVAALALTSACNLKTDFPTPATTDNTISVDLVYADPATKSDGVGKENDINSVEYFFYTNVASTPVFSRRIENPEVTNNTYTINENAGVDGVPTLGNLFNNGQFVVYAVFNAPDLTDAPLADLQQTALDLTFAHQEDDEWVVTPDEDLDQEDPHDKFFVMTGQKVINKASSGDYANVQSEKTVNMKRVAAKVSVKLKIKQVCEVSNTAHWIPMVDDPTAVPPIRENIRVYLCNFVQNSVLGATNDTPTLPTSYTQADYRPYVLATGPDDRTTSDGYYVIESQQDFYTYPIEWEAGSDTEPYIKVVLPWRMREGFTTQRELYYKVMFPSNITSIKANKFYQLEVTLSMLGTEGEPVVTVRGNNAQVVNWVSDSSVSSAVSNAKYLSVEKEESEFFTQTDGISFASSDPVYLVINNVYQENLHSGEKEYVVKDGSIDSDRPDLGTASFIKDASDRVIGLKVDDGDDSTEDDWIELSNSARYLEVGHTLNANLASDHMDVTPWIYDITLKLVNADETYDRSVVFEQWPNVYVIEDQNSDYVSATSTHNNDHKGYVYVNESNSGNADYGTVIGLAGTNKNPNMYVLTISVSDTYIIGDPRDSNINNNLGSNSNNWSERSYWTEGTGDRHRLTYYHPTQTSDDYSTMIAPKIRIASSYGVTNSQGKDNARKRCASYQEDGIPAGRWRLPTKAEVKFICTLSALKRIPVLFGNEPTSDHDSYTTYWTGYGAIRVNNYRESVQDNDSATTAYVRCVYDEWFWGDATETRPLTNKERFTWGDRNY